MKRFSEALVNRRYFLLAAVLVITAVCALLMGKVDVITDMTTFLPDQSSMKQGINLMAEEFSDPPASSSLRVMAKGLSDSQKETLLSDLSRLEYVDSVSYEKDNPDYNKEDYALFILNIPYDYESPEMKQTEQAVSGTLMQEYSLKYDTGEIKQTSVPLWILIMAVIILMIILLVMCSSWLEPFLFLAATGVAVVINMGTNVFLNGVSNITHSIAAILQLVLSMDYSIILLNRYRQERLLSPDRETAMKQAIAHAIPSIASSSLTTVVGLLALIFMSFKIGADMGIVLAKGVLISMICILTVLPALILLCDTAIQKTAKKVLPLPMNGLSRFSFRARFGLLAGFFVLFAVTLFLKGNTGITYSLAEQSEIDPIFPKDNTIVLLYANEDEEAAANILSDLEEEDCVKQVMSYSTTIGKPYSAKELSDLFGVDEQLLSILYETAGKSELSICDLFDLVSNSPVLTALLNTANPELAAQLETAGEQLEAGKKQLQGQTYSLAMISARLLQESAETTAFLDRLTAMLEENLSESYYLIGNSPMQYEISQTFHDELNKITWITVAAIFVVVLITFRTLAVPTILILIIQTSVYATMVIMGLFGNGIYYLALLIVQSILMGATIDYAILFTNYYRESRKTLSAPDALTASYNGSIHTILTSGMIMVIVTWILGYAFPDPTVGQICHIIALGAGSALVLILFVLPGILAALDRWTSGIRHKDL